MAWIATIVSAAAGVYSSSKNSKAAKENAAAQEGSFAAARADSEAFTEDQLALFSGLEESVRDSLGRYSGAFNAAFDGVDFVRSRPYNEFINEAKDLNRAAFDFDTQLKRENLAFVAGDSLNSLRGAQEDFAALAAGDTSAFTKELEASAFGALANSQGLPTGTFGNISANNLFQFKVAGTNAALGLSDFFSREGTVNPPSTLNSIQALADFEAREDAEKLDFEFNRALAQLDFEKSLAALSIDSEQALFNTQFGINSTALQLANKFSLAQGQLGGVGALASANQAAAFGQAAQSIGNAYASYQRQQKQNELTDAQIDSLQSSTGE